MSIVFPCPNCGASQNVNDDETSTTCQFCGNTITVPEALRPKQAPPSGTPMAGMPQAISFAGLQGFPGMAGLPHNLDINKLRDLGHAVRAGNREQAAQLYTEIFGVDPAQAQQIVDTMFTHHNVVVMGNQPSVTFGAPASFGTPAPMFQAGNTPPTPPGSSAPYAMPSPGYMTPSSPMIMTGQRRSGSRLASCISLVVFLVVGVAIAGGVLAGVLASSPGLMSSITSVFNQATNSYPRTVLTFGGKGSGQGLFTDPRTITVDADGNIYVGDYSDSRVQVFDGQGKFLRQITLKGASQPYLMALAASPDGKLYVIQGGDLYAYDSATGKSLGQVEVKSGSVLGVSNLNDVAVRPNGGLALTSFVTDDDLILLNSDMQTDREITDAFSQVTGSPELDMRVAVDGNDNDFILGTFTNAVFQYDDSGTYVNRFGSEGDQTGQFQAPSDVAVDGQGRVYVSDDKGIQVFSADGRYLSTIAVPEFGYAFGITFDAQGALYVIGNSGKVYKMLVAAPQ